MVPFNGIAQLVHFFGPDWNNSAGFGVIITDCFSQDIKKCSGVFFTATINVIFVAFSEIPQQLAEFKFVQYFGLWPDLCKLMTLNQPRLPLCAQQMLAW